MKIFVVIAFMAYSIMSFAVPVAGSATGIIRTITIKETGNLIITFKAAHANTSECGRSDAVVILNSNAQKDIMLSISLSAHAQKTTSSYWVGGGCYEAYGTSYPVAYTAAIID